MALGISNADASRKLIELAGRNSSISPFSTEGKIRHWRRDGGEGSEAGKLADI